MSFTTEDLLSPKQAGKKKNFAIKIKNTLDSMCNTTIFSTIDQHVYVSLVIGGNDM